MKQETKNLFKITAVGATEGAVIGAIYTAPFGPLGAAGSIPVGAIVGGMSAFGLESSRRAFVKSSKSTPQPLEAQTEIQTIGNHSTPMDVVVETTSSTQRTDIADDGTPPIVKSNTEQATGVPSSELPSVLTSLRDRTQANSMPQWRTTINEKTVASTNTTSVYDLIPQRVS